MKAAIYGRFSTENQRDASIDDQFRECERCAQLNNLEVVARFEDRGISGGTTQRPGYQALLEAAREGAFQIIIAEDISRLWRSGAEFGPRAAELEDLGVDLMTVVGDDTRRDGWGLMLNIKQAVAEHARREISYRTRRGLEGRALAGAPTGSRKYGYRAGAVYEPEAAIVRQIFSLAAGGASQQAIADELNYHGVPAAKGGKWRQSAVGAILNHDRYSGRVQFGATICKRSAVDSKKIRRLARPGGALVDRFDESMKITAR